MGSAAAVVRRSRATGARRSDRGRQGVSAGWDRIRSPSGPRRLPFGRVTRRSGFARGSPPGRIAHGAACAALAGCLGIFRGRSGPAEGFPAPEGRRRGLGPLPGEGGGGRGGGRPERDPVPQLYADRRKAVNPGAERRSSPQGGSAPRRTPLKSLYDRRLQPLPRVPRKAAIPEPADAARCEQIRPAPGLRHVEEHSHEAARRQAGEGSAPRPVPGRWADGGTRMGRNYPFPRHPATRADRPGTLRATPVALRDATPAVPCPPGRAWIHLAHIHRVSRIQRAFQPGRSFSGAPLASA